MRAAVTGANGFLGSNLCRRLLEAGWQVTGIVRKSSDLGFLSGLRGLEIVDSGLEDPEALVKAFRSAAVFHCASRASDWGPLPLFWESNVENSRRVAAAAADADSPRLVYISSAVVYGFKGHVNADESTPKAPDPFPYCLTKLEAEKRILEIARLRKLAVTVIRPGNIFGPNDRVTTIHLYRFLLAGKYAHVAGGRPLTCPVYVDNLVDAILLAATEPRAAGEDFIITDGLRISWREYIEKTCDALGAPRPKLSVPAGPLELAGAAAEAIYRLAHAKEPPAITRYRIRQVRRDYHFSIAKARRLLGYEPRVGLEEALRRTVEWYRKSCASPGN